MVAVRVDLHVELLVGLHESFGQFVCILHVYVVIGSSVAEQQISFQVGSPMDGGIVVVAFRVILRTAHVAFRVDGIIVTPVGHRSHGYGGREYVVSLHQAEGGHESAVTPAPDTDLGWIDVGLLGQPTGGGNHIVALDFTELEIGTFPEFFATGGCSAGVDASHDVTLLR